MNPTKTFKGRIQLKHDIEAHWNAAEGFIPYKGEIIIYDPDENYDYERFKIGDGVSNPNGLKFYAGDWEKLKNKPNFVRSVNNVEPDASGNVTLEVSGDVVITKDSVVSALGGEPVMVEDAITESEVDSMWEETTFGEVEIDQVEDRFDGGILRVEYGGTGSGSAREAVYNLGILDIVYPVGSIYMSVNNVEPFTLFGGAWERLKDTFLLAAGDTHAAGETGGEETHTLTVDELAKHRHGVIYSTTATGVAANGIARIPMANNMTSTSANTATCEYVGSSEPHNNMPPYLAVYMWKRIG